MASQATQRLIQKAGSSTSSDIQFSTQFSKSTAGVVSLSDTLSLSAVTCTSITAETSTATTLNAESATLANLSISNIKSIKEGDILYVSKVDGDGNAILSAKGEAGYNSMTVKELTIYGPGFNTKLNSADWTDLAGVAAQRQLSVKFTQIGDIKYVTMGLPQVFQVPAPTNPTAIFYDFSYLQLSYLQDPKPIPCPLWFVPNIMKKDKGMSSFTTYLGKGFSGIGCNNTLGLLDGVIVKLLAPGVYASKFEFEFGLFFQRVGSGASSTYTVLPRIYKGLTNFKGIGSAPNYEGLDSNWPGSASQPGTPKAPDSGTSMHSKFFTSLGDGGGAVTLYENYIYTYANPNQAPSATYDTVAAPTGSAFGEIVNPFGYYSKTFMYE